MSMLTNATQPLPFYQFLFLLLTRCLPLPVGVHYEPAFPEAELVFRQIVLTFHMTYEVFEEVYFRRAVRHSRRRTNNWSFRQYIELLLRLCPQRGIEWSHAVTTLRLVTRTKSSNDPESFTQPSPSMSLVSSRYS